jgi:hypothetical protein
MQRLLAAAAVAVVLAGCATQPSIAERCTGYGFTPDTTAFAECQQREVLAVKQANAMMSAALFAGF